MPWLQSSDRLRQAEFERLYLAMPNCKKAEWIEEVVYTPSPARLRHSQPRALLMGRIVQYAVHTEGSDYADYELGDERFKLAPQPADGIYRSQVLPGRWLNAPAMIARRGQLVTQALQLTTGTRLQ